MEREYTVYMHIAPSGKKYVGITSTKVKRRWMGGYGYKCNPHFYRAIKKYGWDSFEHIILYENLSKQEAEKIEIGLIAKHNLTDKRYGYNIENGGNAPGTHSEETLKKMSEAQSGSKNHMWGKKGPLNPLYGRKASAEAIEKNRLAHIGITSYWKGRHISEDTKKAISKAQSKRVICVETGETFDNITSASKWAGVSISRISKVCKHMKRARSAGGYHWEYVEEVT